MLFGTLNPDIFSLFSGSNKFLYEQVLLSIYERFYRSDLHFPGQGEVIRVIYDTLGENLSLWREDEVPTQLDEIVGRPGRRLRRRRLDTADAAATNEAMSRARHVYHRLVATGWIEESRYGLKITVDMPPGAMRLAEFLCNLREGLSEQLGGLVVQVKNGLDALRLNARENAPGLHKAARDAASFGRYLRSVLSALREIDKQVLASGSLGERLRHYFEDFVERVLLQDYASITTTSHPYRYRHRILDSLDALEESVTDIGAIAEAYVEARIASDALGGRQVAYDDLHQIRRVFEQIEEAFGRIQQHRARLETRLRNTVRYAGRRTGTFLRRSEPMLLQLDRLIAGGHDLQITGPLTPRLPPLCPALLAKPRGSRAPVIGDVLVLAPADPVRELRRRLEREYLERLAVNPAQVSRFLERRVPPFGATNASSFPLNDVDDFLAFEALRLVVSSLLRGEGDDRFAEALERDFTFSRAAGVLVDNDWLSCPDFRVARRGDNVTLETRDAA